VLSVFFSGEVQHHQVHLDLFICLCMSSCLVVGA
jgi:hypothetical protein